MKTLLLFLVLLCTSGTGLYAQHNEVSYSNDNNSIRLKIEDSKGDVKLTVKGDVRIAEDDRNIQSLSPNGYISYQKKNQSLDIEADGNGNLSYKINGDKKTSLNAVDKALIEDCIKLMIAYGIDAENRVERILAQKGTKGMLNEVNRLKSDYAKEIYLSFLLSNKKLSNEEMISLLDRTSQYLSSDYYQSELLKEVMPSYLSNAAASDAYLKVVNEMFSDYYQYTTVQRLLNSKLDENQYGQVLAITADMSSDYYQSKSLEILLQRKNVTDEQYSGVMKIVAEMNSDYYQSEIILELLKNNSLGGGRYATTIAAMKNMKSDYYQAEILNELVEGKDISEAELGKIIQYAGSINSDYYLSEVLVKIAERTSVSSALKKELNDAAKKISSDYYYGKVMRAIEEAV